MLMRQRILCSKLSGQGLREETLVDGFRSFWLRGVWFRFGFCPLLGPIWETVAGDWMRQTDRQRNRDRYSWSFNSSFFTMRMGKTEMFILLQIACGRAGEKSMEQTSACCESDVVARFELDACNLLFYDSSILRLKLPRLTGVFTF